MGSALSAGSILQWGVIIGASLLAAAWDIRTRTIPNRLTGPLALAGLVFCSWQGGVTGLGESLLTLLLLALPFALLFLFGGGGAGDAKLMGAIGAWLPLRAGVVVLVTVTVTGGVLAILRIVAHRNRRMLLARVGTLAYVLMVGLCSGQRGLSLLMTKENETQSEEPQTPGATMPYGPAIFIGVCISAIWVHAWMK